MQPSNIKKNYFLFIFQNLANFERTTRICRAAVRTGLFKMFSKVLHQWHVGVGVSTALHHFVVYLLYIYEDQLI